jgi:hypothetical protein
MEFIHFLSMATFKTQVTHTSMENQLRFSKRLRKSELILHPLTDNTDARGFLEGILTQNIRTLITSPAVTNSPILFLIYTV